MADLLVPDAPAADRDRITRLLADSWGGTTVVAHGRVYDAAALPAMLAERDGDVVGLLTKGPGWTPARPDPVPGEALGALRRDTPVPPLQGARRLIN